MGDESAEPQSGVPASGIGRIRLLLVDGDDGTRSILRTSLEAQFDIVEAATAKESLARLYARWFRVVLTDHRLPDRDGIWLLKRVARRSPYTWRVLMSAWSVPRVRHLRDTGVLQLFMAKPIHPEHFIGYFASSA